MTGASKLSIETIVGFNINKNLKSRNISAFKGNLEMFGNFITVLFIIALLEDITTGQKCPDVPGGPATRDCDVVPGCDSTTEIGLLLSKAKACSNELPDADCEQLFPCNATGTPPCDDIPDGTPGAAYVRAPACTSPTLQSVALKCRYSKIVIIQIYINRCQTVLNVLFIATIQLR